MATFGIKNVHSAVMKIQVLFFLDMLLELPVEDRMKSSQNKCYVTSLVVGNGQKNLSSCSLIRPGKKLQFF